MDQKSRFALARPFLARVAMKTCALKKKTRSGPYGEPWQVSSAACIIHYLLQMAK
jgi:hypothetical protein